MTSSAVRRAVVTGGAGFIGSHLCEALVGSGVSVVCVDDLSTGRRENLVELERSPLFRFEARDVIEPFGIEQPVDYVVHLASPASPIDYLRLPLETLRVNSAGTENALRVAQAHGARFLLASTSEVYGNPLEHPQRESYWGNVNPIGPRSVYDEGKRYAEAVTSAYRRTHGVDTAIARLFNCYGPRMRRDDGRVVPTFVGQALAGRPLTINGSGVQTRSLCFVDDTVRGLMMLLFSSVCEPVNIGGVQEYTVRRLAEYVAAEAGVELRTESRGLPADDPTRRRPDVDLALARLGWRPEVSVAEGLRRTMHWWSSTFGPDRNSDPHPLARKPADTANEVA